eukprot:TRINITY_DN3414_c0_g3_i1.p1 TRINITY_DN3414_c0_g3~~TRINITY_DN3414_c0_g3_i1.p1  ORF type:complete len:231 (+),score=68.38 TRINITY_DN3414_c0_g3_i1:186-878(+)
MLKLKQLQQKQAAAKSESGAPPPPNAQAPAPSSGGVVKRQDSQEQALIDLRKQKSKESYFTLKSQQNTVSQGKRAGPAEIRAQRDISEIYIPPGCHISFPNTDDIMNFKLNITPGDGMYKEATFNFSITVPVSYPYDPPKVHCDTLVYHPNIDYEGHVCLNILRQEWLPVLNLGSVIVGLLTLFLEPNPEDPLNKEAAQLMIENRRTFEQNVKQSLRGGYVVGRSFPKLL